MDRIDPAYYVHSSRIDLNDETRVNATNDEAEEWRKQNEAASSRDRSMLLQGTVTHCLTPYMQRRQTLSQTFST